MPKASDRIGPYQLIHKLGAGGFGEVWLAQDFSGSSSREVAVKIPLNSEIDLDGLLQEATLWARASGHLNVLEFLAARVFDGQVVLVSEYAPDGSLKDWLSRYSGRAPSVEAAVEMARGILAGLEHLHARSIIHRDIKPDNVLLLGATPRLADFGISRVLKSTGKNTFIAGTPHYMAPEAFNRRRNQQADLWSVGVMLYQMLSGRLPFEGNDWAELYGAILNENPEPLPTAVPEWLRQVVAKTLTKDPERRYQSAQEMREALRQIERDIEAEIAERERREVERRRLEEEELKRLEEEARRREIERQRQIEEAARLHSLQEELSRKEEELAKLKRALPHEAVTKPIVRQPDETVTEPIVRRPVADERRIDREKVAPEPAPVAPAVRWKTPSVAHVAIAASVLIVLITYLLWNFANSTNNKAASPTRAEAMLYWLELENAAGKRVSGLDPLPAGERFRLHFKPSASGYLYLIAPGEGAALTAFVTKRRIEAGADFRFPGSDNWINVGEGARFIVIFSPELLNELPFLSGNGRRLTQEEEKALRDFRDRLASTSPETRASNDSAVVTAQKRSDEPLVFEINVIRQLSRVAAEIEMVLVPGGSFLMGSPDIEPERLPREGPQQRVTVPSFYIGKYEVTQAQWRKVAGLPKVYMDLESDPAEFKGDDLPVEMVSYWEAREFCTRLSRETGRGYRLPSEAEWEYAARAGTTTPFAFGSSLSPEQANFAGNYPYGGAPEGVYRKKTTPVGSFAPNAFKLHDMHGNVWEWCEDVYHDNYNGAPTDGSAWLSGGDSRLRVMRGGSWNHPGWLSRSAYRTGIWFGKRQGLIGFRVVVSAETL